MRSGINNKAETSEITVKGETGHIVEQRRDNHIGDSIAKRKTLVCRKSLEDFFGGAPRGSVVKNYVQRRFDFIKKLNGKIIIRPVPEKCSGFADNVPSGLKKDFIRFAEFKEFACTVVVGVVWA